MEIRVGGVAAFLKTYTFCTIVQQAEGPDFGRRLPDFLFDVMSIFCLFYS